MLPLFSGSVYHYCSQSIPFQMDSFIILTATATTTTTSPLPLNPTSTPKPQLHPLPSLSLSLPNLKKENKFNFSSPSSSFSSPSSPSLPLPLHSKNPHIIYRHIQRLAKLDKLPESLAVLDYLEARGIPVNATTFASLLSACSRSKSLIHARHLHAHIRTNSLHLSEFIQHRLVRCYSACGSLEDACRVFDQMPNSSVFAWNALLKGAVLNGRRWSSTPMDLFLEMRRLGIDPDDHTFSCLIKSFAGSPAFAQGTKAHALLIKKGIYDGYLQLQTGLVDMYFKCGRVRWALKVFEEIPQRDVVLWGTVIAGLSHNKLRREAVEYLRWMGKDGVDLNPVIVTLVLPAVGDLTERSLGREIHAYAIKRFRDYDRMVFIQSALIDMYCSCGDMVSGRHVFYGTAGRNEVSWTALMSGYASNGWFEQALRSIVWMQQEGVKPDVVTIATVLPVCKQLKALRQGKEIHSYALKHGFLPNVFISASLMTIYSECGMLELSCRVFDEMRKKNIIAWTALIDSYIKNERLVDALKVFRYMRLVYHRPDAVALGRVLSVSGILAALKLGKEIHAQVYKMKLESTPFLVAEIVRMYGKNGDIGSAKRVFDGVRSKGSLTCTAIIEAYGCNGCYREAADLFDWMHSQGFMPNHFTFEAMLAICERAGFVDEAVSVFELMIRKHKLKATEEHWDCIIGILSRAGRVSEAQRFLSLKSTLSQV